MMTTKREFTAVITAAGNSRRMNNGGDGIKKEYCRLPETDESVSVLSECLFKFLNTNIFNSVIITVPETDLQKAEQLVFSDRRIKAAIEKNNTKPIFTAGGKTRQKSVFNALLKLSNSGCVPNYVLIHDGARPWVSTSLIRQVCSLLEKNEAVVPCLSITDTPKIADETGKIITHLKRSAVYAAQTPQGFKFNKLLHAHKSAAKTEKEYTDDSEIYSDFAGEVFICKGETANKKITFKEDLECVRG